MYLSYIPRIFKIIFPQYTWHKNRKGNKVYLTFDDGPTPEITPWVLDQLKKYNARATFFLIGKNVAAHPEIVEETLKGGHTIANHTYNHLNGYKTTLDDYIQNVDKCAELVDSRLFRPPYGRIKHKQAKELLNKGYEIIMWDVLSADFDVSLSGEDCINNVKKHLKAGSIIVFHDSIKAKERLKIALPAILKHMKENNLISDSL